MNVFKPIMTSALLSDDQELPTLDSFWYMTSHILKWTNIFDRVHFKRSIYMYKITHDLVR